MAEDAHNPEPADAAEAFSGYVASRTRRRTHIDLIRKGLLNMLKEVEDMILAVEAEKTESRAMDTLAEKLYQLILTHAAGNAKLIQATEELRANTELTRLARIANTPEDTPENAARFAELKRAAGLGSAPQPGQTPPGQPPPGSRGSQPPGSAPQPGTQPRR